MKILHIAPSDPFGGLQKVVFDLAVVQAQRGHDTTVAWISRKSKRHPADISPAKALEISGTVTTNIVTLRRLLKSDDYDIIHLHMPPPWVACLIPNKGCTTILHLHGLPIDPDSLRARLLQKLELVLVAKSNVLISVSQWIEKQWRDHYPEAIFTTVHNGIPLTPASSIKYPCEVLDEPCIGFASRLEPDKGVYEFAEFALHLVRIYPNVRILVAGDGSLRPILEKLTSSIRKSGHISFLGFVEDMNMFWSQTNLAVTCSKRETFGLSLIEPVVCGVPVIAYKTGSGADEVINRCAAITSVPYGQSTRLAYLARNILLDPIMRHEMVVQGLHDVEVNFSIETMADKVDQVYNNQMLNTVQET